MRYLFLLPLLLFSLLQARENPFKPVIDNTVLPVASNEVKKAPPFRSAKIKLPNDARVVTSIAVYYQSIDGSIKKEVLSIDRSIDWHKPIVISQQPPSASKRKDSEVAKKSTQKRASTKAKKSRPQKVFKPLPFLKIALYKRRVDISTKDEKIRSFHLSKPFKVAVDFRRKAGFLTKHIPLDLPPFKSIDIGNHNGYYRVVVTMDAPYRYRVVKREDGYSILLP